MKKSFKGFVACLLALLLVIPAFSGVMAEGADYMVEFGGTLEAKETVSIDLSGIRNGKTFQAATAEARPEIQPSDIVTIMVELEAAPAADVVSNLKNAGSYREQLVASQKRAAAEIESTLGVNIEVTHNYSVLFNGFAFDGEYRLVELINNMDGMRAFVAPEWESPKLFNTTTQVGAVDAWELGYTGLGYTVAIIDTGAKVDHPAFANAPESVQFTRDDIAAIIASGNLAGSGTQMNVNNVYYSAKIPFKWNYYSNNADVSHRSSDHGTHVAGIAAGNGGEIRGVAPDAQIAVMQVFAPSGGANWSNILPALEDSAVLGVSGANLSLGSPCGTEAPYDPSIIDTLERCVNAGVNLAMAAGNDYDAAMNNAWGGNEGNPGQGNWSNRGYNLVQNTDNGVIGSPSTWPHSLAVAAVQNSKSQGYYISVEGNSYGYNENAQNPVQMVAALGGQTLDYVMVPGFGTEEDFASVNVTGKVALVSRGEINFVAKAENAEKAGAVACVIYNNVSDPVNMVAYTGGIPHVIITRDAGAALAAASEKKMFISTEAGIFDAPGANMTTNFSSRGLTANMAIKPEITAPGGQIYSATDPNISQDLYQAWDGTSMATPHVCGGMAIVTEYVKNNFPNASVVERQRLVDAILMSTATPIFSASGDYAPVHEQGAGEMNLAKATKTKAYVTVEGTYGNRPKVELGDDPNKTGSYTATFTVHNFGSAAQSYTIQPSVLINDIAMLGTMGDGSQVLVYSGETWNLVGDDSTVLLGDADKNGRITIADAILVARQAMSLIPQDASCDVNGDGEVNIADAIIVARQAMELMPPTYDGRVNYVDFDMPATVNVPANGQTSVTVRFSLNSEIKNYLNTYYTSGANIEGFIELIPASENDVSLTVPFLGYYGDWNYSATVDRGYYYQDADLQWNSNTYTNTIGYKKGNAIYGLGINPYVEPDDMSYYLADRNAISPNGDGVLDTVNLIYFGTLRNAYVRYLALDTNGAQLGVISDAGYCWKGFFKDDHREQVGITDGVFPPNYNFTQFNKSDIIIRAEAKLDNDGAHTTNAFTTEASENWKWDIPVHIDTTAPVVANFAANGGNFTFNVTDEHYVAYAAVFTCNGDSLGTLVGETGVFENERGKTTQITIAGSGNDNFVVVADYAGNEAIYRWNGSTLTPVEGVEPPPAPVGNYQNGIIFSYGLNLLVNGQEATCWIQQASTNLNEADMGESAISNLEPRAGTYDPNARVAYAWNNADSTIYKWSMTGGTLGAPQSVGSTGTTALQEMAFDPATNTLYGCRGAYDVYTINKDNGTLTPAFNLEDGVVAMAFDANGVMYYGDMHGVLHRRDMATGADTEVADLGITPVNGQGNFYPNTGAILGNTFYWGYCDANGNAQTQFYRVDVTNGAFESLGTSLGGLYVVGMFLVEGNAIVNPNRTVEITCY